jgi:hypothetical protein
MRVNRTGDMRFGAVDNDSVFVFLADMQISIGRLLLAGPQTSIAAGVRHGASRH